MTSSTGTTASARAAFTALVDYAGLFPPAELAPADARREYAAAREGPHAWMLGRYIVTAALAADAAADALRLSVIVDPDAAAFAHVAELRRSGAALEALEIPLAKSVSPMREQLSAAEILDAVGAIDADLTTTGLRDLPAYLEIPNASPWRERLGETLSALARFGLRGKFRCGGITAGAFPSVDDVARFIEEACGANVAFKTTAGLHHPVRHVDPATGFTMHGFLNVLAAAAFAGRVDRATLTRIVAEEEAGAFEFDAGGFAWREQRIAAPALARTRADRFVGYGSCSFTEPVEDLIALRILPPR